MRCRLMRKGRVMRSRAVRGTPSRILRARFMRCSGRLPRPRRRDATAVGVLPGLANELSLISRLASTVQASRIFAERVAQCAELIEGKFYRLGEPRFRAVVLTVVEQSAAHSPQNQLRPGGRHFEGFHLTGRFAADVNDGDVRPIPDLVARSLDAP